MLKKKSTRSHLHIRGQLSIAIETSAERDTSKTKNKCVTWSFFIKVKIISAMRWTYERPISPRALLTQKNMVRRIGLGEPSVSLSFLQLSRCGQLSSTHSRHIAGRAYILHSLMKSDF